MKSFRLVCLLLLSASLGARSNLGRPATTAIATRTPQGPYFASRSAARRIAPPQSSGLDFAPAVTYGSGGIYATSVATGDVNGDGKLDLLVANDCVSSTNCSSSTDGSVSVLLGNGDGTFQTAVSYSSGGFYAQSLAVADVNGDGKLDLLVATRCCGSANVNDGTVAVMLGNGDGTFQTAVPYDSGGSVPTGLAVTDLNGDGKPDVVVANTCGFNYDFCGTSYGTIGTVGILLGNGDGTFRTAVIYDSGGQTPFSLALGDVNNDGKPDLVVANTCANSNGGCSSSSGSGIVGVLLGNGDGTFQTAVAYGSGGIYATSVTTGDVNGDGKLDLLVANACSDSNCVNNGTVAVMLGNGDGTFQTTLPYDSGGLNPYSVAVADVNGDGKLDLLAANDICCNPDKDGTVAVLLGNGDGTFQTAVIYDTGGLGPRSMIAADVNGDGKLDLLAANNCASSGCSNGGSAGVLLNTGTIPTMSTLVSSANPSAYGQTITLTANVAKQFGKGTPTGTVSFLDGTANLGSSILSLSGVATITTSTLAVGTHSITATYSGDSNFTASTSPALNQIVQGAVVHLSQVKLNFGNQTVGIASTPQIVTLTNTGNITLTITSIGIGGIDGGDFAQGNTCGSSVSAGGACTVTVTFTPKAAGTRNGTVTITDNGAKGVQTISLIGVGVQPAARLSPTSLTFSTQVVFTTSKAQTVTLSNTGLGILSITKVALAGPFTQTNTCGTTVNPGSSCTFTVTFKPTTIGALPGSISITDNAPLSPQNVTLSGTGTAVQLTPASLNFGNQPVGTNSLAKKITLSNKSSSAVNIGSILIAGANASDFAQANTCGSSVAAGASCFINVTFTPSAKGSRSAAVNVNDNGGGSPQKISLTGTGT